MFQTNLNSGIFDILNLMKILLGHVIKLIDQKRYCYGYFIFYNIPIIEVTSYIHTSSNTMKKHYVFLNVLYNFLNTICCPKEYYEWTNIILFKETVIIVFVLI